MKEKIRIGRGGVFWWFLGGEKTETAHGGEILKSGGFEPKESKKGRKPLELILA